MSDKLDLKKVTTIKCYDCGKPLTMTCLCRACANRHVEADNQKVYIKRNADRRG